MAGERLVAELGEAALHAERDAGSVEQDRGLEAFAHQARRLQQVDETDRAFEGDGVEGDQRFLAGLGFDVFEYLLLVIDEIVALLMGGLASRLAWAPLLLAPTVVAAGGSGTSYAINVPIDCDAQSIHSNHQFTVN